MAVQPETRLVNLIRKRLQEIYPEAWIMKVAGGMYQSAGVPDLLIVIQGHLIGMEVKRQHVGESAESARGRVTLRQQAAMSEMSRAGASTLVVLSVDEAVAEVKRVLRLQDSLEDSSKDPCL